MRHRNRGLVGLVVGLVVLLAAPAQADVVSLAPLKDNTLYEDDSGDLSNGSGERLFAGNTKDQGVRRAVIAFDVAGSVPAGAAINSVTLTLNMSRSQRAGAETFRLHRLLEDWGEGTSVAEGQEGGGASATPGDATWLHTFYPGSLDPGSLWATPGGLFDPNASAAITVDRKGAYTWGSTPEMVADVEGWLADPGSQFGWILIGNEAAIETAKRFDSREIGSVAVRPVLQIDFTPGAGSGACCADDGTCGVPGGLAECSAQGGSYEGDGTTCTPNPCPQPAGACCLPDAVATCNELPAADCATAGGSFQGELTPCATTECPVVLTPFLDALPLPAPAQPTSGSSGGMATYDIAMREVQQQLHSELAGPTTVWGYGDGPTGATYPGPTIEATVGQTVTVNWINDLPNRDHYLPVDTCPHGADDASPRTVVHLHGAHVPEEYDGYPEATFLPGQQATYIYENNQLPATLWYHDHALGITRLNVYMGLAGAYLLRDDFEASLGLPSDEYEVPLIIQDRSFHPDGSLKYVPFWQDLFFGDTMLVNGKVWPFHEVKQGKYRLRLLNGSNSRTLALEFCPNTNVWPCPSPAAFQVLGQEGGLLEAPTPLSAVTLGPGERTDLVFDFAAYPAGTEVFLVNSAPAPFPGDPDVGVIGDVMKFVVVDQAGAFTQDLPTTLRPMERLQEADAVEFREFELKKGAGNACSPFIWEIVTKEGDAEVGALWDDVTEFPELDTTEVWSFINLSGMTHPMHMHLVMFQVLDRQAFSQDGGVITPIGSRVPPPPHEAGWKDTVQVGPNEIVRVIARFESYTGLFAYHCHILEHEDHEMMRQFRTVKCGNGEPEPGEDCDLGDQNGTGGCCSTTCTLLDADGDGLCDALDNCPETANPGQADAGGVDTSTPDGIGDDCQCGDVTDNGIVQINDATVIKRAILGLGPGLATPLKCNVVGTAEPADGNADGLPDDCAINDATVVKRAILGLGPGIGQVCDPAVP